MWNTLAISAHFVSSGQLSIYVYIYIYIYMYKVTWWHIIWWYSLCILTYIANLCNLLVNPTCVVDLHVNMHLARLGWARPSLARLGLAWLGPANIFPKQKKRRETKAVWKFICLKLQPSQNKNKELPDPPPPQPRGGWFGLNVFTFCFGLAVVLSNCFCRQLWFLCFFLHILGWLRLDWPGQAWPGLGWPGLASQPHRRAMWNSIVYVFVLKSGYIINKSQNPLKERI